MSNPINTDWVVITGPPSSGKTTVLNALSKLGYETSGDSTRALIERFAASGRSVDEFRFADDFQPRVLEAMLEAQSKLTPDKLTFLEFALPCNIAFHRTESRKLTAGLPEAAVKYKYKAVFILDPLPWNSDGVRAEDAKYQGIVHGHFGPVYRELGYAPVAVPVSSVDERVRLILAHLEER